MRTNASRTDGVSIGGCMELNDDVVDRTVDVSDPSAQQVVRAWLTADEVIEHLGRDGRHTTTAAIHQRRRRGRLLGARVDGRWRYAPIQFGHGRIREDVEGLLRIVTCRWPAEVASWFVLPCPDLADRTPEEVLLDEGLSPELRQAARDFGTTGWVTPGLT